jgi:hypothetical protein
VSVDGTKCGRQGWTKIFQQLSIKEKRKRKKRAFSPYFISYGKTDICIITYTR